MKIFFLSKTQNSPWKYIIVAKFKSGSPCIDRMTKTNDEVVGTSWTVWLRIGKYIPNKYIIYIVTATRRHYISDVLISLGREKQQ